MPIYEYYCEANNTVVEVQHSIKTKLKNWGDLCKITGIDPGETEASAEIERLLFAAKVNTPVGNSHLKNIGFTKLERRDNGVYENVTATGNEKRYMTAGDPTSVPDIKRKISD